ncbi:MAG: response regulator [Oscillatoria sp. SIO1A7]|nr:response regulator [Oscillatoria sp. SIO1A7]
MNAAEESQYKGDILVVDDTPANLRLLVGLLTEKGYKVRATPNGKLALSGVRLAPPDLILLDIMMPEIDGYEVCANLKADEQTRDIPVIFISAINEIMDKVKAFGVGGVDYITKPFHVEEVLARVETHLALRCLQKSLQEKNEDLAKTLTQLQKTQDQLVQSEKMAALGQLVAGIAHEVNTPLGAIRSSVENIAEFLTEDLSQLPLFLQNLSPERQQDFFTLLEKSASQSSSLSSKQKRKLKRALIGQLESREIGSADILADTLVDLGVYDEVEFLLPLLQDPDRNSILNMAYQLASLQKSTKTIATATDRAAKVVFALKTYARYDSTGAMVEANIPEGIETVLTLYDNQIKQGVEAIANYNPSLPSVLCYPDELNQVWTNLIHNALQAMDNKGILKIDVVQKNGKILVSITDNGKGIPTEIIPKIFEPFFTTKPPGQGSGLGLDIVSKIIDKHRGTIEVESVPGQTTFTVSLPIAINEGNGHV